MRTLTLFLVFLSAVSIMQAQEPLSQTEALKQIYSQYDAEKGTAQWVCTKGQQRDSPHEGWLCWKEYATVSVDIDLMAEVSEGSTKKVYIVTSAKPTNYPDNYECHACAPAIGVAVFAWQADHWALESANAAVGFYGGWGGGPLEIELVQIGLEKHGLLLSDGDEGQGFSSSFKNLLAPLGNTINQIWSIEDEQDDEGAYDPTDKFAPHVLYRSSAAIRFYAVELSGDTSTFYYDIEVISRGNSSKDNIHLKPENWTEIYRFKDGKYRLIQHNDFTEIQRSKSAHLTPAPPASSGKVK
jgi:hypothetical protein